MKKWLIRGFVVLAIAILGIVLIGLSLPEEHQASRTLQTRQPAQTVWDAINDHTNEQQWRSDVASVASLGDRGGRPVWQENYKDGEKLTLITTESKPPHRLVRELTDIDGPFSGRWEIDIQPTASGSNVKVTEIGKVSNPIFRFVSRFLIGHTTSIERYLKDLARKFGEEAQFAQ